MNVAIRRKKHLLFCRHFEEHVYSFIKKHNLLNQDKKISVAVSGGVDSMALAWVLKSRGLSFSMLHFNHGTRPLENAEEESIVRSLALKFGVELHVFHFQFSLKATNFEQQARDARLEIYKKFINEGHWLYQAHHIDDSFEWSLMQSFKQGSPDTSLGIPVFNKGIVRPFMCVTKKQILRYARAKGLFWLDDESNQNLKFERNFVRAQLVSKILGRYPQALKHYVTRANLQAKKAGLHIHEAQQSVLKEYPQALGGMLFLSDNFRSHREHIKKWVHFYSSKSRGEIGAELDKLLLAQEKLCGNSKLSPFIGPMHFSGGVKIYIMKNGIFITNDEVVKFYQKLDLKIVSFFQKKQYDHQKTQIPVSFYLSLFPFLTISNSLKKNSKFTHPLLPQSCQWLKIQGIPYTFALLLDKEFKEKIVHSAVVLDSSILDL